MPKSFFQLYLRCQFIGWSSVLLNLVGFSYLITKRLSGPVIWYSLVFCLAGLLVLIPWANIYWLHFHIILRRKLRLEEHRLELLLKEKELSATEPSVAIEFIAGSLDRIGSLIDEDPASAREGINTFSRMLQKGRLKTD